LLTAGLVLLAVRTVIFALQQRDAADRMEEYWFRLRDERLDPPP